MTQDQAIEEKFRRDFIALLAKYGAALVSDEDYDGNDRYMGKHYTIEGQDLKIPLDKLVDESWPR